MPRYQQTEDLARYGQSGVPGISKDIPGLTVTGIVQPNNIAAALNRVSDFAFKSIEPAVQRQAAQYAFDNPITIEQLKKGAEDGFLPQDFTAGSDATNTIRKIQAAQAHTALHADLVNQQTDVMRKSDAGQIPDIDTLKREIYAPIAGHVKALALLDKEAAVRLEASASGTANAAYKHGLGNLSKDAANLAEITSSRLADNQVTIYKSYFNSLFTDKSKENVVKEHGEYEDAHFKALLRTASAAGDSAGAKRLVADNRKAYQQVRLDEFAEQASSEDHSSNMRKITSGDFGHMTPLWKTLTSDEKNKVGSMVANKVSSNLTAIKQQKESENLVNERGVRSLLITNDRSPAARSIIKDAYLNGGITKQQLEDYNSPSSAKATESQERLFITLAQSATVNRDINPKDEARLTKDQRTSLMKLKFDTDTKSAQKFLDLSAGDPGGLAILKESTAQRKIVLNQYFTEAVGQINADGSPKYPLVLDAAKASVNNWNSSNERVAAKKVLEDLTATFSKVAPDFKPAQHDINVYIDRQGIDDTQAIRLRGLYKRYKAAKDLHGPE